MRTINPERGLELKIILNASKRICWFHFETDFIQCDMNDVTMPHVLSTLGNLSRVIEWYCLLRKTLCTTSSVSENRITFCEINNL